MALMHVNFFSSVLGMCESADVVIPQRPIGQNGGKIQTLYLLHGMSDDQTIWQRRTSIERYADEKGICVVMPTTHLGWYTNTQFGMRYFDYIARELPEIMRGFFRDLSPAREDNFAAGLSMGGYGAMKIGLLAPEAFGKIASLSGALNVIGGLPEKPQERLPYWLGLFGENAQGTDDDLPAAAKRLAQSDKPKPEMFIWCGEQDFLYQDNLDFVAHLQSLGFDPRFTHSPGDHQWKYWDEQIQAVLNWL